MQYKWIKDKMNFENAFFLNDFNFRKLKTSYKDLYKLNIVPIIIKLLKNIK